MRKPEVRQFQLESLDRRMLPSSVLSSAVSSITQSIEVAASKQLSTILWLKGTIRGNYQAKQSLPDLPTQYALNGKGTIQVKMGHTTTTPQAQVDGYVNGTGFIQNGRSTGLVVLKTAQGQVTLELTGPRQPGFQGPAKEYKFVVQKDSGTGTFHGAHGSGTVKFAKVQTTNSLNDMGNFMLKFV